MNHLYGNEKEGYIPVKDWTEEIKTYYHNLLESYETTYREYAENLKLYQSLSDSYKNNDSAAYYDALSRRAQREVGWDVTIFRKMNYPGTSLAFTQDIYREAGKRGAKPLVGEDVISISPYNNFESPKVRDEYVLQTSKNEADGFFFPYELLISEHSGLLCLTLLLLMVMTGYTTDREGGAANRTHVHVGLPAKNHPLDENPCPCPDFRFRHRRLLRFSDPSGRGL